MAEDLIAQTRRLLKILNDDDPEIVTDQMVDDAEDAARKQDRRRIALIMVLVFSHVAEKAGGYPLRELNSEELGRRIGWALSHPERRHLRNFLHNYSHTLAKNTVETYISYANLQQRIEVRRTTHGATCNWCLDRAGVWDAEDAIRFGVFSRHNGCDCEIEVRKA